MPDYEPLLMPTPMPGPRVTRLIDLSSWILPAVAAILSLVAGAISIANADNWATRLGIGSALLSALGVLAANRASWIRDQRLMRAQSTGDMNMELTTYLMTARPPLS